MAQTQPNPLLRFLRRLAGQGKGLLTPDADLLRRFADEGDRSAFELLLWRHGPMVLAVCRQVLRDADAADDAFQAAFLTLARKAGSIGRRDALGAWLHQVAYRIALKLLRQTKSRADRERQGLDISALCDPAPQGDAAADGEVRRLLHAEVERLPAKYRAPVVLCYLEGRTNEEAATQLGWSKGTVSGRLARARDLLRRRLERCGLPVTVGAALTLLAEEAAAAVPAALFTPTLHAALTASAGGPLTGVVAPQVFALSEGALKAMSAISYKLITGVLLGLTVAGAVAYSAVVAAPGDKAPAEKKAPPAQEPPAAPSRDPKLLASVASPVDGILLFVGAEVEPGKKPADVTQVRTVKVGKEVRRYRPLRVGDRVEQGQGLAQIDDRLAQYAVAFQKAKQAAAQVDQAAAAAFTKEAQARLDRLDRLKKAALGVVSEEDYSAAVLTRDKYVQEELSKREGVNLARIEVIQVEVMLERLTIRSPVRGVVRAIRKHAGEGARALDGIIDIAAVPAGK